MISSPEADPESAGKGADAGEELTLRTPPILFDHYEILSRVGAGGMGEVYVATDIRLGRKVALKILPVELTNDADRIRRLEQEARTASALNHPNIVTVHELGRAGSSHFIAQEFVEGVTLRELLRAGPMQLDQILDITLQVGAALEAAHSAGIIHRDIKPENIMVRRDGLVKVLDFGLAKFVAAASMPQLQTSAGVILGTLQYMSPEQASGADVDARTDLWSLGVVLYEMVARRRPFEAPSANAAIARILQDDPPKLDVAAPLELQRMLNRVLAKNRNQRYASAADFCADLSTLRPGRGAPAVSRDARRRFIGVATALVASLLAVSFFIQSHLVMAPASGGSIDSLAVLPFVNETGNAELDYVVDGLTDTLTNAFSGIESFRVVPRASTFHYKGRTMEPLATARELKVRAILTGRVTRSGDVLAIQAELIDSAKGSQIWGERFTASASDALELQQHISQSVLTRLSRRTPSSRGGTTDKRAFDLYLRARHSAAQREEKPLEEARQLFTEATQKDPQFAAAYRGLTDAYMLSAEYAGVPWEDVHALAVSALQKSITLDPTSAEGHAYLGRLHAFEWHWKEAEHEFESALRLDPGYSPTYIYYGNLLRRYEQQRQSLEYYKRGLQLDPMSRVLRSNVVEAHIADGDLAAARAEALELIRFDPAGSGHRYLAHILAAEGKREEAVAELDQLMLNADRSPGSLAHNGATYAIAGARRKALDIARELEERYAARRAPAVNIAEVYAALGDRDKAFEWLAKDSSKGPRMSQIPGRIYFRAVHDDPRWEALMQSMGLRESLQ